MGNNKEMKQQQFIIIITFMFKQTMFYSPIIHINHIQFDLIDMLIMNGHVK